MSRTADVDQVLAKMLLVDLLGPLPSLQTPSRTERAVPAISLASTYTCAAGGLTAGGSIACSLSFSRRSVRRLCQLGNRTVNTEHSAHSRAAPPRDQCDM